MPKTIRMKTHVVEEGVIYEIFADEVLVWSRFPKFQQNAFARAGGPLFRQTAKEQEDYAKKIRED